MNLLAVIINFTVKLRQTPVQRKKNCLIWSDSLEYFVRQKEILSDQKLLNDILNVHDLVKTDARFTKGCKKKYKICFHVTNMKIHNFLIVLFSFFKKYTNKII